MSSFVWSLARSPVPRYLSFSSPILRWANRNSGPSSGSASWGPSQKSVSKPNRKLPSRLARNRTSSASIRSSMFWALVSMLGITTSVAASAGMPREKSIRGNGCGATSSVASQFTKATASWLVESSKRMPMSASCQSVSSRIGAIAAKLTVRSSVSNRIAPR